MVKRGPDEKGKTGGQLVREKRKRWVPGFLVAVLILTVAGAAGFRLAGQVLEKKVAQALGPGSEVGHIRLGLTGVEAEQVRIRGLPAWPASDELRAERVKVVPSLLSLFSGQYHIRSITVIRPYLSVLRTREGRLQAVPGLLSAGKDKAAAEAPDNAAPCVSIGRIILRDGVVELFDATVAAPPLKIRLEDIQAGIRDITAPSFDGVTGFDLAGVVKGAHRDGRVHAAGWVEIATKDSSVSVKLQSVDLTSLQPYLLRAHEAKVVSGALDLDLKSDVSDNHLSAPGRVSISDLTLAPARNPWATFMGVPRNAVLELLKSSDNRITLHFVLEGDMNNPRFSLNETLSRRLAVSLADALEVNVGRVAEEAGEIGSRSVEAAGEVMKGLGNAVQNLFGGWKGN